MLQRSGGHISLAVSSSAASSLAAQRHPLLANAMADKIGLLNDGENGVREPARITGALMLTTVLGALGSGQFGWGVGVMNAPQAVIETDLGLPANGTPFSMLVAALSISAVVGAQLAGRALDNWGRRKFLIYTSLLFLIGGGLAFAASLLKGNSQQGAYWILVGARVFLGLGVGASSAGCPLYLGEIAPAHLKGAYGSIAQFSLTIFLLLAEIAGIWMSTSDLWGYLLGVQAVLGVVSLVTAPWMIESPRWLVAGGADDEAAKVLMELRGYSQEAADEEVDSIRASVEAGSSSTAPGVFAVMSDPAFRTPILVAIALQLAQQFSGINAVFFFSTSFFKDAGISDAAVGTVAAGAVNVLATGLALYIIDRVGRKPLLLVGAGGMGLAGVALTAVLALKDDSNAGTMGVVAVAFVLIYVVFFEIGLGSIPWMIGGEMLPEGPRATGMSLSAAVNWIATTVVALGFLPVKNALGAYAFVPFVGSLALTFVFTIWFVPETKGKTPQEVLAWFRGGKKAAAGYENVRSDF